MSTQVNQIIEVRVNGEWKYVPVASNVTEQTDCLVKYGSVRDLFAYHWYDAESYISHGVPNDISKLAREAMIYETEDYINSGACWISLNQYETMAEVLRENFLKAVDKLSSAKMETRLEKRLESIENMISKVSGTKIPKKERDAVDEEYIREDMEDAMWAWCSVENNISEIKAYVGYLTSEDYNDLDVRIIMYVS